MAVLKIEMPIHLYDENTVAQVADFFRSTTISWTFCQKEAHFFSTVTYEKKLQNSYTHEIIRIKQLLKIFPNNNTLKADLKKYEEKMKNDWEYDVIVCFEGEIAAEIDVPDNTILHYTGPLEKNIPSRDIQKLKKHISSDRLDDFYETKIKPFIICMILAGVLTNTELQIDYGKVNLYFENEKYQSESFIDSPLYLNAFENHQNLFSSKVTFEQAFSWIAQQIKFDGEAHSYPVAITALTYVLNREDHESLLYSVMGLESIYTPGNKGISYVLQKRINHVFPSITPEQIKGIYDKRSKFVHEGKAISPYHDFTLSLTGRFSYDEVATLALALLIETIRILIANNATKIYFDEKIFHRFK